MVRVEHEGPAEHSEFVRITYTRNGKVYRLKARAVVMAGGSWTTKHMVIDLPSEHRDAYAQFFRSPCMIVNVALRNWRFLYKLGISGAFWYGGLGIYGSVRKAPTFSTGDKTMGPDSPVVMTIKVLFCRPGLPLAEQQNAGRAELLSTSFRDYERRVREQLTEMFAQPASTPSGILPALCSIAGDTPIAARSRDSSSARMGNPRRVRSCAARPSAALPLLIPISPAIPATPLLSRRDNVPPASSLIASRARFGWRL